MTSYPPAAQAAAAAQPMGRLGLATKLSYGLGSIAFGIAGQALSTSIISQFLFIVVGVPALLIGTAIMISQIVDAVVDPMLGLWSDNVRTPWGRRHPFMYAAAIPGALAFYALWHPPLAWDHQRLFAYMVVVLIAVRFFNAMYEIPSAALAPELAPDYHDRTALIAWRWVFGLAGVGVMTTLLNVVFLRHDATHKLGILNRAGYGQWGAIAAGAILVSILLSSLATHRLIPRLSAPPVRRVGPMQALRDVRGTFSNPSLVSLIVAGLLSAVGGGITAAMGPYLYLYFWGLAPQLVGVLTLVGIPSTLLGAFLAPAVSSRFGKKPTMIALFATSLVAGLIPISLRLVGLMPPNGSPWLTGILIGDSFVSGMLSLMGYIIVGSMAADIVEDSAVRTGVRSEGLLFAANGLIPKISGGIGAFGGSLIVAIVHLPSHAQQGTIGPEMLRQLGLIYLPVSAIMNGAAITVLSFYRIDKATHERNLATLAAAGAAAD
jgi:Na+/melibiose symporter-like transporter